MNEYGHIINEYRADFKKNKGISKNKICKEFETPLTILTDIVKNFSKDRQIHL